MAVSPILSVWLSAQAFSQTAVNVHSSLVRPMNAKLPSARVTSSNVRGQPGVAALIDTPSIGLPSSSTTNPAIRPCCWGEGDSCRQDRPPGSHADECSNDAGRTKPHGRLLGMSWKRSAVYRTGGRNGTEVRAGSPTPWRGRRPGRFVGSRRRVHRIDFCPAVRRLTAPPAPTATAIRRPPGSPRWPPSPRRRPASRRGPCGTPRARAPAPPSRGTRGRSAGAGS